MSSERVLAAWRNGESFVALSGGGLAPLPVDWLARFGEQVADLLVAKRGMNAAPACRAPRSGAPVRRPRSLPVRPSGVPSRRCCTASRASQRRRSRQICGLSCAATSVTVSRGSASCATRASARCSPTTWALARRCRRSAPCAGVRSSWHRPACSTTGPQKSLASAPRSAPPCITGRDAHSTPPPT